MLLNEHSAFKAHYTLPDDLHRNPNLTDLAHHDLLTTTPPPNQISTLAKKQIIRQMSFTKFLFLSVARITRAFVEQNCWQFN